MVFPSEKPVTAHSTLTERETTDYINRIISSLEHALRNHVAPTELHALKQLVLQNVRDAQYAYQKDGSFFSSGKRYKKEIIDQFLNSAIIEYIEAAAYKYAYSRTHDHTIAGRISSSMRNNVLAVITQQRPINFKKLAPFVGYGLERAVADAIAKNSYNQYQYDYQPAKPSAPTYDESYNQASHNQTPTVSHSPAKLYTSDECVICSEDFGGEVKRVYLKPCGHDICQKCAFEWFFGARQKKECPHCRSSVNLTKLEQDII